MPDPDPIKQMQTRERFPVALVYIELRCSTCHEPINDRLIALELGGVWCAFCPKCDEAERNQPCPTESS